ncbi:methyltransferase type 11 [Bacillaceae bacterium SAS-127]|nr:methyltransferase type 11 [Bacillaceae bacterium SAS-127]
MKQSALQRAWETSYKNKDNFVFYPHEEIIRFAAKYIVKRTGINQFKYVAEDHEKIKVLDLGCGIGRHVIFFEKMSINAFGIDLSVEAIERAHEWAAVEKIDLFKEKVVQGSVENLPWVDETFNFIISHGVLDSMPFTIAKEAVREAHRVLIEDGLFYCDLISGDDSLHSREYASEELVITEHEKNTVQSYFNFAKIQELVQGHFHIEACKLIKNENCLSGGYYSRYHLVLKKKGQEL